MCASLSACVTLQPYEQRPGTPYVANTTLTGVVGAHGYRLELVAQCQAQVVKIWCNPATRERTSCMTPPTVTREAVACPRDLDTKRIRISLRTPWGSVVDAVTDDLGIAKVPIDWASSNVDPLGTNAGALLAANWLVRTQEREIALPVTPQDVGAMLTAIGDATDTQYGVGAPGDRATLTAEVVAPGPLTAGATGSLGVSIHNDGPGPAHRVIAKLKSGVEAFDGIQLSFGRIDAGKTKVRHHEIVLPSALDDRNPIVLADITYANGQAVGTRKRLAVGGNTRTPEKRASLEVTCKPVEDEVSAGAHVRLHCDLKARGQAIVTELRIAVSVAGQTTPNVGPRNVPVGGTVSLDFVGNVPSTAKQGQELPVVVTVTGAQLAAVSHSTSVRVASLDITCKEKLTREQYRAKRRRLQTAFEAGALTQRELDKYDADLVRCLK